MMYVELKPTVIGSPEYGVSIVSSLSPLSVDCELIFNSFDSSRSRIAPDRSSANCATRWIALDNSLDRTTANFVLSRGITAS